jgi:protein FrlC
MAGLISAPGGVVELERFAFSTHAHTRYALSHALSQIAAAGFKGVEILADKPHAWLDSFSANDQESLIRQLKQLRLFVSNVNAECTSGFWSDAPAEPLSEPSLISAKRELREWRIAYSKKALRLGKALNALNVSVTSGKALALPPEKSQKLLEESLKRLIEYAESIGQPFSLAYEPLLLIERSDEMLALIKKLGSKYFGASVDVASVKAGGDDPAAAIRKLKGRIFHVHLADLRGRKLYPRVPGDGDLDFKSIFNALDKAGYAGPLTWNLPTHDEEPDAACRKTFKFVKSVARN